MGMSKLKCVKGLISGHHFDREVLPLCVRWSLRYKLSLRDLVEVMAERELAHTTIMRWIQRYVREFEKGLGLLCTQSKGALPSASLWTAMRHRTGRCVNCQARTRHGFTGSAKTNSPLVNYVS